MISIKFLLNMLVLLTLAQFYNYFSFFRLHLFLVFIVVVVIGVVIGSLLAFRTTEFVIPNLEPRLCRPPNRPACFHDHLDDLVTYKTYSDIINYLNNPTTSGSTSSPSSRANNNERCNDNKSDDERNSLRRIATTSVNGQSPNGQDHQRKSLGRRFENMNGKIWASCDNLENGGTEDLTEPNEKTWSAGGSLGGGDEDESGGGCDIDSVEDDNESQSNSKVETYLDELTELFVRDYIMTWLSFLIWEKEKFSVMAKNEFRQILNILRKRLRRVDYVKLVSRDLIYRFNQHFLNVKRCSNLNEPFKLNYYEMDQEKERDHLRNIVEIFLLNTFPEKSYFRNNAVRYVVRELLVNGVLIPSIELVCDPDYLNQKLLDYMASRENVRNNLNNKFSHAATYEDFIRLIKSSNSVDELKQLHLKIMNEIMQATVINEFKSSSSLSSKSSSSSASLSQSQSASNNGVITCGSSSFFASFSVPKAHEESGSGYFLAGKPNSTSGVGSSATGSGGEKSTKAEQLRSRNLKIYIKQLQYAKMLCEKRMQRLNAQTANNKASSQSMFYDEDTSDLTFENKLKNRKIVPIETILSSSKGLSNFLKYLEHDGSDRLLRFWIDVEKLKNINAKKKYELANKIYEIYLNTYDSPVRDEIGKDLNKSMQLFLIGNNTDEGFFKAQDKIKTVLENEHYPSFIVTELYEKALEQIEDDEKTKHTEGKKKLPNVQSTQSFSQLKRGSSGDPNKAQVDSLVEKLEMKMSALNAFKSNGYQQCDSKLVEVLKNDIEKLKHDISIYETHIQKTELWCDNIGKWKTKVAGIRQPNLNSSASQSNLVVNLSATSPTSSGPEKSTSSESYYPLFEIHVELFDDETPTTSPSQFREGWVIYRSFRQFEALNEALYELIPAEVKAKFKRIPSSSALKQRNVRLDEERARQITAALDDYLRVISQHEKLAQSEALYTFLCPSPDYFKRSNSNHHPNSNDESLKQKDMNSADDDEYLDRLFSESYLKTLDATNAARDSIAEPFYYLFEELFEIKGVKKLLRKSFIVFVQLTYGANINRAIRERVYSVVLSDEYVSFYLKQFKDAYWKFDEKSGEYALIQWTPVVRSLEEKIKTKKLAKLKLIANIPEILSKLVGDKNSQIGIIQLFEIFQDKQLNKHLFYSILEMFILELFPEAHVKKQLMQTTTGF